MESGVHTVRALLEESTDLQRLIKSPVFSTDEQTRALDAVMDRAGVDPLVANFMKVVARNRRLFAVPAMLKSFDTLLADYRGEVVAEVTSAGILSEAQQDALRQALQEKASGTIKLETHVDPTLIGGLVVRLGSQMIDTSVRTRLAGLRMAMKEAS